MPFQQQPPSAPYKSSCTAACLVIISGKGYEPKLELFVIQSTVGFHVWVIASVASTAKHRIETEHFPKALFHLKRRNKKQLHRIEICNLDWNRVISEYHLATGTNWDRKAYHQITYMGGNSKQTLGRELHQHCVLPSKPLSSKVSSACTL